MYCLHLRRAVLNSTRTVAAGAIASPASRRLRSFSDTLPERIMAGGESEKSEVTRLLFCGPHFPASHIYTREYLAKYPFIQVDDVPLGEVPDVIANYHLCVVKSMRLDANLLSRSTIGS